MQDLIYSARFYLCSGGQSHECRNFVLSPATDPHTPCLVHSRHPHNVHGCGPQQTHCSLTHVGSDSSTWREIDHKGLCSKEDKLPWPCSLLFWSGYPV